ncbi:MAG: exo-alpha-sialidase, partial [Spirochaetales bacterium]|nr:exo-alpha-sialidase [Spirochaetales bacterium]
MKVNEINAKIEAEHGILASYPGDFFGYFGWPSIARMSDGTLVVAASGLRNAHVCPFGKTILCMSTDNGVSWTPPAVVNDFPVDDRDAGVCSPAPDTLVVSWFSSDTRISAAVNNMDEWEDTDKARLYRDGLSRITDTAAESRTGYWVRVSRNRGESWDQPIRVALTAPHGSIAL